MSKPWQALEEIRGLIALLPVWRRRAGPENFAAFRNLCLQVSPKTARLFPCPLATECAYRIIQVPQALSFLPSALDTRPSTVAIGFCQRDPRRCEHVQLSQDDITPLELNWKKLGREICKAFGLDTRFTTLPIPNTVQIGTWSADAVPVILTVQCERPLFRFACSELVSLLNQKFILLAPTATLADARSTATLNRVGAQLFMLETTLRLTDHGTLHSIRTPGELFAKFTPQPKETDLSVAERAYALIQQLGPKVIEVFQLYCVEELSAEGTARELDVSKRTVLRHLKTIGRRTGTNPRALRRLSAHLSHLQKSRASANAENETRADENNEND
jgi:hypothetical protein